MSLGRRLSLKAERRLISLSLVAINCKHLDAALSNSERSDCVGNGMSASSTSSLVMANTVVPLADDSHIPWKSSVLR
ncbi:MAG: hypothetical protein RBR71_12070 [Gudongella sp.]|nr:hypothetical protein [Gudongella sp.]